MPANEETNKAAARRPLPLTVPVENVPIYGWRARQSHTLKPHKTGYHKPKSRKKTHMAKRASVRDSNRAFRVEVIASTLLSGFQESAKGIFYSGAPTLRHP